MHFIGKDEEYIYLLENGTQISVKPYPKNDKEAL